MEAKWVQVDINQELKYHSSYYKVKYEIKEIKDRGCKVDL